MKNWIKSSMYVCKLFKSLYRLKQAGRKWYNALCKALADIGFNWSEADPAVFYVCEDKNITILACHVNNCMITGNSQVLIQSYKDKLKEKYSLTDLGATNWLLGIKITRDLEAQSISLSQSLYIYQLHSYMIQLHRCQTICNTYGPIYLLTKDQSPQTSEEITNMHKVPYHKAIGLLNYCAVAMQPDIAFPVSLLAQFMENPGRAHWEAVKTVFCYLSGTKNWELVYGVTSNSLEGFTDADRSSQGHQHTISGYVSYEWRSHLLVLKEAEFGNTVHSRIRIHCSNICCQGGTLASMDNRRNIPASQETHHSLFWLTICNRTHKRQVLSYTNKTYQH